VIGPDGAEFRGRACRAGEAYVLDETGDFATRCNKQGVGLERLDDSGGGRGNPGQMIQRHAGLHAEQAAAALILSSWAEFAPKFVKVHAQRLQAHA